MRSKSLLKFIVLIMTVPVRVLSVWQPADMSLVLPPEGPQRVTVFLPKIEYSIGYNSIDSNGNGSVANNLDSLLFGQTVTIGDLSLASRLAAAAGLGTFATPATTAGQDEYLGDIADADVEFNATQKMFRTGFGAAMTFNKKLGGIQWSLGFAIPFEYYEHGMNVVITGGQLGTLVASRFAGVNGLAAGISNQDLFAADHNDIDGYWQDDILDLKGLEDTETRRSLGIGSTRIYSTFHSSGEHHRWLISAVVGLPTGSRPDGNVVWPIERGTSASPQVGFQGDVQYFFSDKWQLYGHADMMKSFSTDVNMRVPKLNTATAGTSLKAAGILANIRFTGAAGTVDTDLVLKNNISAYDSLIPYFADNAISVKQRLGIVAQAKMGCAYNAEKFILNWWYSYYYRQRMKVRANLNTPTGTFNYDTVTARTNQHRHTFGWEVEYPLQQDVLFGLGSTHVLKGKNTPKYHQACLSFKSNF